MKHYAGQHAQEALKRLAEDGKREQRLKDALQHLMIGGREVFIQDSHDVLEQISRAEAAQESGDLDALSSALCEAIETIFATLGGQDAVKPHLDD